MKPFGPAFRVYFWGQCAAVLGGTVVSSALSILAVDRLGADSFQVGLLTVAGTAPMMLFGLPIAAMTDRVRRPRRVLLAGELILAGIGLAATVSILADRLHLVTLLLVCLATTTVGLATSTLYFVHLKSLVPADRLMKGRARLQGGEQSARLAAQSAAGHLAVAGGFVVFAVAGVLSLVSALSLGLVGRVRGGAEVERPPAGPRTRGSAFGGFRLMRTVPLLGGLVAFVAISALASGAWKSMTAVFVLDGLGLPARWYSWLFAGASAAALAGTVLVDRFSGRWRSERLIFWTGAFSAVPFLLLPLATGLEVWSVALVAASIAGPAMLGSMNNIALSAFVTKVVPERSLGRLIVSVQLVTAAATVLGALAGGWLGTLMPVRSALWIVAGVACCAVPLLWRFARTAEPEPAVETDRSARV